MSGIILCGCPTMESSQTCNNHPHVEWYRQYQARFSHLSFPGVQRIICCQQQQAQAANTDPGNAALIPPQPPLQINHNLPVLVKHLVIRLFTLFIQNQSIAFKQFNGLVKFLLDGENVINLKVFPSPSHSWQDLEPISTQTAQIHLWSSLWSPLTYCYSKSTKLLAYLNKIHCWCLALHWTSGKWFIMPPLVQSSIYQWVTIWSHLDISGWQW